MKKRVSIRRAAAFFIVVSSLASGVRAADKADKVEPLLAGKEFSRELEQTVAVSLSDSPLRDALGRLSRNFKMAIVLDRRIDPDQRVKFEISKVSADEAFKRLASQLKIGVCYVGSAVYFGPTATTNKLATLAAVKRDEALRLPDAVKRKMLATQAWQWDELATPRELVQQLLERGGPTADDTALRKIPHDLWPAVRLPTLSVADRLTIVLAGFDLTYEVEAATARVKFVPVPDQVTYEHSYSVKGDARGVAANVSRRIPAVKVTPQAGKIHVSGLFEDHEMVEKLLRGEPAHRVVATEGEDRFTLKVENKPFESLARALGQKLMLEVEFDPQLGTELQKLISFEVQDGTLDQLLQALTKPAGVSYKLQNKTVRFGPAAK